MRKSGRGLDVGVVEGEVPSNVSPLRSILQGRQYWKAE